MKDTHKNRNQNNFNGTTNFNGPVQIAAGNINNNFSNAEQNGATYTATPIWRTPLTLAILSWISVITGILGLIPASKIVDNFIKIFNGKILSTSGFQITPYIWCLIVIVIIVICICLAQITKKQIRVPLKFNYAINGYEKRIVLEKIETSKCPICGGKMRYYNKPVSWRIKTFPDGSTKKEVTMRKPFLECKRNHEHCYEVDPAEDKIK